MLLIFLQTYLKVLVSIGAVCLFVMVFGLLWILKPKSKRRTNHIDLVWRTSEQEDLSSISGNNIYSTQLDLARAYIETNHLHLAKQILDTVMKHGSKPQQQEAEKLLASCDA